MNSAWAQTGLSQREPSTFFPENVGRRNSHIFEINFPMAVRRIIVSKYVQVPEHSHPGCVHRYQNNALLFVSRDRRVRLAHKQNELAARIVCPGSPPLSSVDDVLPARPLD
eukprot:550843_1